MRASARVGVTFTVVGATALLVAGCAPEPEPVQHPAGTYAIVVNQPTPVDGKRVVVSNVDGDTVNVDVFEPGSPVDSKDVTVGTKQTVGGLTFTVLDIQEDTSDQPPGGDRTTVWLLPE